MDETTEYGEQIEPLTPPGRLGLEDYLSLPDDGKRYEIIDGDIFVSPAPNSRHQWILSQLHMILGVALQLSGRGRILESPSDVVLGPNDVVQPDMFFVSKERLGIIGEDRVEGAPDLVLEVLSPGTSKRDRGVKAHRYARAGVSHYWLVDPKKNLIEVDKLDGDTYRQTMVVRAPSSFEPTDFPGVKVDLAQLFA